MFHADKAPGLDGFSAGFYHSYWDIIGEDIYRDICEFFETGQLHQRQNETHIRLIPKVTCPRKVSDFRPIALCTTHYKIIAKILTNRLQPLLPRIISPHQSAFVPKRAIGDNVLITHEILHYLRTSQAKVRCSMAVKTDMSKAYNRIEWSFLEMVLQRLGFHEKWISWIMTCVTSVSYSFLINDGPQGRVLPSRGLRQGDPLSPYLFILCTEVLLGMCTKAQEAGQIPGIKVARNCPPINHLLFADDTMFFTRSDSASCANLLSLLAQYEKASGQCISPSKSAITFSSKTPGVAKDRVKLSLGIDKEGGIGKYLGLPEHFGRKKRDIFNNIIDRIRQRAISWSSRDVECFNQALLAKIAWRLLEEPDSLLGQTLRGKYFSDSSLLDCSSPNSASHGWRGILWGRDLLIAGLGWSIGNGETVNVWRDPWLSPQTPTRPMGPPTRENQELRVSDLILGQSNEWNLQAVRQHLPQYEDLILQIIPSSLNKRDELVWLHEKSGKYSTKSGYAISRLQGHPPNNEEFPWKKCISNINTAPKIQTFLWKARSGALPVGSMLLTRGFVCYTDGAWDPRSRISGQGWVISDHLGATVMHQSSNRSHVASPLVVETLAVKAALLDAVDNGFLQLTLFSNSKTLVNLLNSSSSTLELQSILFDIRVLSRRFESISFSFIPRAGNVIADSLAKSALHSFVMPLLGE
ncbi:uncharacterized protein LOC108850255 [Raphanus sativus]|uniref:Uncharacterized protein LOC108850255 n=1 Tax=Raphanus sativus TaxID=3726 RepID=A0A9W3DJ78_RAPSA|nr:uncharacterized protein LOC108850255 [Raphanus sativus]